MGYFQVSPADKAKYGLSEAQIGSAYAAISSRRSARARELSEEHKNHSCALCESGSGADCINNPSVGFGSWPLTILDVLEELGIPR